MESFAGHIRVEINRRLSLTNRIHDVSRSGFNDWPFMTVHQWGESPQGVWQLEIHNKGRYMGKLILMALINYGRHLRT